MEAAGLQTCDSGDTPHFAGIGQTPPTPHRAQRPLQASDYKFNKILPALLFTILQEKLTDRIGGYSNEKKSYNNHHSQSGQQEFLFGGRHIRQNQKSGEDLRP